MSPYGVPMGSNGQWEPLLAELGTPKCRGNGGEGLYGVYMGCYEALWLPMGLYGVPMGFYGSLWALYGVPMWSLWGLHGVL